MRTENYQKTKAFVDSGDIYDLGLYSMEDAVRIIGRPDPDFADLCGAPQPVASLAVLILSLIHIFKTKYGLAE